MHKLIILALGAVLTSTPAFANLVTVDLYAPGDGLLTRDAAADLEWLDVSQTQGLSINDILADVGGWRADAFRHATEDEICDLLSKLGEPGGPCPAYPEPLGDTAILDALGMTFDADPESELRAWFDNASGSFAGELRVFQRNDRPFTQLDVDTSNVVDVATADPAVGNLLVRKAFYLKKVDLFDPDDELLTRDPDTNLDWLDVTETQNLSFNDILADRKGWKSLGFRHATTQELCVLLDHFGAGPNPCPEADFHDYVDKTLIFQHLGQTFVFATGAHTFGWFDKGSVTFTGFLDLSQYYDIPRATIRADVRDISDKDQRQASVGNLLVRAVPEPSGALLNLIALITLAGIRAVSKKH